MLSAAKTGLLTVAAILFLGGCEYYRAVSFDEDDNSGVDTPQTSTLSLVSSEGAAFEADFAARDMAEALAYCRGAQEESLALSLGAALVGTGVDMALGFAESELASKIEGLKAKSERSYKATLVLESAGDFAKENQCLIFQRVDAKDAGQGPALLGFGLSLVLAVRPIGDSAFTLSPIYLEADNALAITAEGAPVKISVGFVGKNARTKDGEHIVEPFAESTFSFDKVAFGETVNTRGVQSGLVAMFPTDAKSLELSVAITETGSEVPDEEKALGELKSLKEAVGPTLKEQGKALFTAD